MDFLEEAVAEEHAENAPPKRTDLEPISLFDVRPVVVYPISFIEAARNN
jgi:hypothetical protein